MSFFRDSLEILWRFSGDSWKHLNENLSDDVASAEPHNQQQHPNNSNCNRQGDAPETLMGDSPEILPRFSPGMLQTLLFTQSTEKRIAVKSKWMEAAEEGQEEEEEEEGEEVSSRNLCYRAL